MRTHTIAAGDAYPELESGINVLRSPSRRSVAFHRIAVPELDRRDGITYWIDARNNASTYALTDLARSARSLDSLRIARAFTAYQHHELCRSLVERLTGRTALVVAPAVADLYRDDDVPAPEDERFLRATIELLDAVGETYDIPVLLGVHGDDRLADRVRTAAVQDIRCERTRFGFRYSTPSFTTSGYWTDRYWQTTIPYWVELFGSEAAVTDRPAPSTLLEAEV